MASRYQWDAIRNGAIGVPDAGWRRCADRLKQGLRLARLGLASFPHGQHLRARDRIEL